MYDVICDIADSSLYYKVFIYCISTCLLAALFRGNTTVITYIQ